MLLVELFDICERDNMDGLRIEISSAVHEFMSKMLRGIKSGQISPQDANFTQVVCDTLNGEYLGKVFDDFVSKYPMKISTQEGDVNLPSSQYTFSVMTLSKLAQIVGPGTRGHFNVIERTDDSLIVLVEIAVPDELLDATRWKLVISNSSAFDAYVREVQHIISSVMSHELNHYRQYQKVGSKWVELYFRNMGKSHAHKLVSRPDSNMEYLLQGDEIDSFAITIAFDLITAIKQGYFSDIPSVKRLLSTEQGIAQLCGHAPALDEYHKAFKQWSNPKLTVYWRKQVSKARLVKKLYSNLMNKVIFHLDNYVDTPEKTYTELRGEKLSVSSSQEYGGNIRRFITGLLKH